MSLMLILFFRVWTNLTSKIWLRIWVVIRGTFQRKRKTVWKTWTPIMFITTEKIWNRTVLQINWSWKKEWLLNILFSGIHWDTLAMRYDRLAKTFESFLYLAGLNYNRCFKWWIHCFDFEVNLSKIVGKIFNNGTHTKLLFVFFITSTTKQFFDIFWCGKIMIHEINHYFYLRK